MAINFDDLVNKVGDELDAEKHLLIKKTTNAMGQTTEMRDFSDIAQLSTIAKNQAAAVDRDANGIMSRVEMDPLV